MSKGVYDLPLERAQRIYWLLRQGAQFAEEALILTERVKCHCEHIAERVLRKGKLGEFEDANDDSEDDVFLISLDRLSETAYLVRDAVRILDKADAAIFDAGEAAKEKKE